MNRSFLIKWLLFAVVGVGLASALYLFSRPLDGDKEGERRLRTIAVLSICGKALEQWQRENGRLPTLAEGLTVLNLKSEPLDGWNKPIVYRPGVNPAEHAFELYSTGPRGVDENGKGDNISYWETSSSQR